MTAAKVLIIGLGNMGGALARGLLSGTCKREIDLRLIDVHESVRNELAEKYKVTAYSDLVDCTLDEDIIFLCIKPQDLSVVCDSIKNRIKKDAAIVSILAGVTIEDLENALDHKGPIIRSMPNITATVLESITVLCANENCSSDQKSDVSAIFESVGEVVWGKESHLDAVTGLSGSGPAYIYMVIEALTDGGVKMGLPRKMAHVLATQTVIGAGKLVKESGLHPAILKDRVTTPGGTTINAIHELEAHGLRSMLISAVVTATEKSKELREK